MTLVCARCRRFLPVSRLPSGDPAVAYTAAHIFAAARALGWTVREPRTYCPTCAPLAPSQEIRK